MPRASPVKGDDCHMTTLNLAADLAASINAATTRAALDHLISRLWAIFDKGGLDAPTARRLEAEALARRDAMPPKPSGGFAGVGVAASTLARRPRPRSPDRAKSIALRRRMDASGAVPPRLAEHFTEGQRAVLAVVGREAARSKWCDWPMDKIAALAGVGRTTVRNALRLAQSIGLVRVQERRHSATRSDTNVVTIKDGSWWGWLRRWGGGRKNVEPSNTQESRPPDATPSGRPESGLRRDDAVSCPGNQPSGGVNVGLTRRRNDRTRPPDR